MNHLKKFGIMLFALGLTTALTQAVEDKSDATLRFSGGSFALGIGWSWGSGTLTYKGKDYPVKVKGLSIGKVGMTSASAQGPVYNLKHLQDIEGNYHAGGSGRRGVTLAGGKNSTMMTNQAGVIIALTATQQGVDVNMSGGGVEIDLKK